MSIQLSVRMARQARDVALSVGDIILSLAVFFPLMCCYFRGIYDLLTVYVPPQNEPFKDWVSLLLGSTGTLAYFTAPVLKRNLDTNNRVRYFIVSRVFLWIYCLQNMAYWHGIWELANWYLGTGLWSSLLGVIISYSILLGFRCSRMAVFPPFLVMLDSRPNLLDPNPRFVEKVCAGI